MRVSATNMWSRVCSVGLMLACLVSAAHAEIYYYEMDVAPDNANLAKPMTLVGDGFGDLASLDFEAPENAGLQGDGTARFSDTGSHGNDGFYVLRDGWPAFTVDLSIAGEETVAGTGGRSIAVHDGGAGRGIQIEPGADGGNSLHLDFISNAPMASIDFASTDSQAVYRRIRLSFPGNGTCKVYDLEGEMPWTLKATVTMGGSGYAGEIEKTGGFALNSLSGGVTTNSKFLADYARIDTAAALGENDDRIPAPGSLPCNSGVEPLTTQSSLATEGQAADPVEIVYTLSNTGTSDDINYTAATVDAEGAPLYYTWLSVDKIGGGPLSPDQTDDITATIDTTGLTAGEYTGYVGITDDCDPARVHIRQINLKVIPVCGSDVDPHGEQSSWAYEGQAANPPSVAYTFHNLGGSTINYTVTEVDVNLQLVDYPWLSVSPESGTIDSLQSAEITAFLSSTGIAPGEHDAYLLFSDDCDPPNVDIRQIEFTVIAWTVWPDDFEIKGLCKMPREIVYEVTNHTAAAFNYTVTPNCDWITVVENGSGPIDPEQAIQVKLSLDPSDIVGSANCSITFGNDRGLADEVRSIEADSVDIGEEITFRYNGDVDPETPGAAGGHCDPGDPEDTCEFAIREGVKQGELVVDRDATDCYAWHLNDTSTAKTKWRTEPAKNIGAGAGGTVVARVKTLAKAGASGENITIYEAGGLSSGYMWAGPSGQIKEVYREDEVSITGDDQYHIIRLTARGNNDNAGAREITLYFDEDPVPVIKLWAAANASYNDADAFGFGAGSTAGTQDIYFDWVTATDAGAFAPGEEEPCLASLVIKGRCNLCADPVFDVRGASGSQEPDGMVDEWDFDAFMACATGPMPDPSLFDEESPNYIGDECVCMDVDKDKAVDQTDFGVFQLCHTGADGTVDPACDNIEE